MQIRKPSIGALFMLLVILGLAYLAYSNYMGVLEMKEEYKTVCDRTKDAYSCWYSKK